MNVNALKEQVKKAKALVVVGAVSAAPMAAYAADGDIDTSGVISKIAAAGVAAAAIGAAALALKVGIKLWSKISAAL